MLTDLEKWKKRNPKVSNPAEEYFSHLMPIKHSALTRLILLDGMPSIQIQIQSFHADLTSFKRLYTALIEPEDPSVDTISESRNHFIECVGIIMETYKIINNEFEDVFFTIEVFEKIAMTRIKTGSLLKLICH
jgi:hypothetical protein